MFPRTFGAALAACSLLGLTGCGQRAESHVTRLIDRFKQGMTKNSSATRIHPKSTQLWSFSEPAASAAGEKAMLGWTAANGVSGLSLQPARRAFLGRVPRGVAAVVAGRATMAGRKSGPAQGLMDYIAPRHTQTASARRHPDLTTAEPGPFLLGGGASPRRLPDSPGLPGFLT